ncbi:MAG TPA: ORF6N domain-containing protein [Ignavibacteriaceae bacterium]|nr:ORF6N domain-containing protein [Ignavibacteriaceae bacterium]
MIKKISHNGVIPLERIEQKIFIVRSQKVMLSTHLSTLYNVEVRALVQAIKRNLDRFPKDFMFQLSKKEFENLKSQIVTSSWGGARRSRPYAFTEQGVAMLSTVLKSKKAVKVNIQIMRAFVKLREILSTHKELAQKLKELELKIDSHDQQIQAIFEVINQLITAPEKPKKKIGF